MCAVGGQATLLPEVFLIGVNLVGEDRSSNRLLTRNSASPAGRPVDDVIGILTLRNLSISLVDAKSEMVTQLRSLPPYFIFLTKEGWPIMKDQEKQITVSHILTKESQIQIKRHFDPPKIAVRVRNKDVIGFIYVDLNSNASFVRQCIEEQLFDDHTPSLSSFYFLERNGWPVMLKQEDKLLGWDVESSGFITLFFPEDISTVPHCGEVLDSGPSKRKRSNCSSSESMHTILYHEDNASSPHAAAEVSSNGSAARTNGKKILISYARCDAKNHAEALKQELMDLGFSVFLDVDDIPGGADWLDTLNEAVRSCNIFVPLVTVNYGETKWTSREVKLADKLRKYIIPVNFLNKWPPDCLAILFCSVNFISWKTAEEMQQEIDEGSDKTRAIDVRYWDQPCVQRVATDIQRCYEKSLAMHEPESQEDLLSVSQAQGDLNITSDGFSLSDMQVDGQRMLSIVISVHPKQQSYGEELKEMLEGMGYTVWCTTELLDQGGADSAEELSSVSGSSPTTPVTPNERNTPLFPMSSSQDSNSSSVCHSKFTKLYSAQSLKYHSLESEVSSSQTTDWSSTMSPDQKRKLQSFRNHVDNAQIVIFVISNAFCDSRMCYKQARYCDFRKHVLAIKYENMILPAWMEMMFGDDFIQCSQAKPSRKELKEHIEKLTQTLQKDLACTSNEGRITSITMSLKKELKEAMKDRVALYVAGSTSFHNPRSQLICQALGYALASVRFVTLVTGGFFGVGDFVARNFCEERELLGEKPASLYHVLPQREMMNMKHKGRQRPDGTFEKLAYGRTVFAGESIKERDMAVAQLFEYCIVIEGGPGTAHEAEKFMWNDHTIIPIKCTGGAAAGKFGMPSKLLEVPAGVSEDDWSMLEKRDITAEDVANAVVRIVCSLYDNRRRRKQHRGLKEKIALTKSYSVR